MPLSVGHAVPLADVNEEMTTESRFVINPFGSTRETWAQGFENELRPVPIGR
jgi:hypothetical protein